MEPDIEVEDARSAPAGIQSERAESTEIGQGVYGTVEPGIDGFCLRHFAGDIRVLAGRRLATTSELAGAIRQVLGRVSRDDQDLCIRRVFQALRIAVNDEFSALDMLLRHLPVCLNPGGRVAILTFHSGEDRRVKKAFEAGLRDGHYAGIAREILRPTSQERHDNPRSSPAKLRWAKKAG